MKAADEFGHSPYVSFGMPNREIINSTFLSMALENGLTMPIINPCNAMMTNAILAFNALRGTNDDLDAFVNNAVAQDDPKPIADATMTLSDAVRRGLKEDSVSLTRLALETMDPMCIINDMLIPTLNTVGSDFENQKIFLPQLISASEACKEAFGIIKEQFAQGGTQKGLVVLATVKGDVHDIGKNIVKVIFESYGYKVVDLGKDTAKETVMEAYEQHNPTVIGLSALMTTTVLSMEETIKYLKENGVKCPIFVGGAVLNHQLAEQINADYYTKDALEFVETVGKIQCD